MRKIRTGIRPGQLAFKQAEEVQKLLPQIKLEIIIIETSGDKDKVTPLLGLESSDLFTDRIEQALLNGSIDIGIHSAKDLERNPPEQLTVAALTASISPYESLVSRNNLTLDKLPAGSRIAASSKIRKDSIMRYRPDLIVVPVRGNIDERLGQLDQGKFDALIVAYAALLRLGKEKRTAQIIPKEIMLPHPLQGRLAIQIRKDRKDLLEIFRSLNEQ